MFWYMLNIAILTVLQVFLVEGKGLRFVNQKMRLKKSLGNKIICIVGTFNWIILSGFRDFSIGADTYNYGMIFYQMRYSSWNSLFANFVNKFVHGMEIKDPGYAIFVKFSQLFCENYQEFLIFVAILFFVPLGFAIYKFSKNPYLSFVLFSTLFYSFFAITGIRQTLVTAIVVLLGIYFIEKRKLIPFLLLFIPAYPIHASAVAFLPFYFISRIKINKYTIACYWVAILLSYIFRYQFMGFLQAIAGYDNYTDYEGAAVGTFVYLLLALAVFVTIFYKMILNNGGPMVTISIHALFIACMFTSFLLINPSTMRLVQYFSLFLIFLLPEFKSAFKVKRSADIYRIVVPIALTLLLAMQEPEYMFLFM